MLALLASLYKDNTDSVVFQRRTGEQKQQFELAEKAAVARVTGMLYNLPDAIKMAAEALEQRKQQSDRMKQLDEEAKVPASRPHLSSTGQPVPTRSYAEKLAANAAEATAGRKEE